MKSHVTTILLFLAFFALGLLTACGTVAEIHVATDVTSTPDVALIEQGIEVYRSQYCGMCHTLVAADTHGTFGPNHDAAGISAAERITETDYNGKAEAPDAYIRESILYPAIYKSPGYELSNHQMPSYSHLATADIDALVYMLVHQVGDIKQR